MTNERIIDLVVLSFNINKDNIKIINSNYNFNSGTTYYKLKYVVEKNIIGIKSKLLVSYFSVYVSEDEISIKKC